jgi:hypothetical protein
MSSNNYGVRLPQKDAKQLLAQWDFSRRHHVLLTRAGAQCTVPDLQTINGELGTRTEIMPGGVVKYMCDIPTLRHVCYDFGNGYYGIYFLGKKFNLYVVPVTSLKIAADDLKIAERPNMDADDEIFSDDASAYDDAIADEDIPF